MLKVDPLRLHEELGVVGDPGLLARGIAEALKQIGYLTYVMALSKRKLGENLNAVESIGFAASPEAIEAILIGHSDGGTIAPGYDAELDELRAIQTNCDGFLLELETREKARTGIANLRVQFNKVHGFYIEVTGSHLDKVPTDYQRRQTLKNAERFITPELKAFEDKALAAGERSLARERELYEELLTFLGGHLARLQDLARAAAG